MDERPIEICVAGEREVLAGPAAAGADHQRRRVGRTSSSGAAAVSASTSAGRERHGRLRARLLRHDQRAALRAVVRGLGVLEAALRAVHAARATRALRARRAARAAVRGGPGSADSLSTSTSERQVAAPALAVLRGQARLQLRRAAGRSARGSGAAGRRAAPPPGACARSATSARRRRAVQIGKRLLGLHGRRV